MPKLEQHPKKEAVLECLFSTVALPPPLFSFVALYCKLSTQVHTRQELNTKEKQSQTSASKALAIFYTRKTDYELLKQDVSIIFWEVIQFKVCSA